MINKKKKGGMAKRYANSYANKDNGSGSKGGVINYRNYDGEIKFFSPAEGKHRINIIPYVIKTKNHPLVKSGEAEIGEKDYVLDFYAHRGVGPAEKTVLCLKNTYGKPCPICEQAAALRKAGKEKEANALKPSRRVVYNIEDLKEPGVLKVFETSHYLFEKELIEEARDDDEGGFIDFADEDEGMEIKFRASKVTKNGMEFTEFKSFGFEDRDEKLDEKLLEDAISFDELLIVPTYEEAEKILYGDEEDDEDEQEDEEPAPKKSSKKSSKKSKSDEEDDEAENDEEDDEDDEPKLKAKCGGNCEKCPHGHKFGEDCDDFDECDDCDLWPKCVKASK